MRFPEEGESRGTVSTPRRVAPVPAFPPTSTATAVASPVAGDGEEKKTSKWKLTKKINRIYADWLDDLTPPHLSPAKEIL